MDDLMMSPMAIPPLSASLALPENGYALRRRSFPSDFVFGSASSSYQYEGAAATGGKSPSIWDTLTERYHDKIFDKSSGAIANDSYHRYKEDVALQKKMGLNAYRFSISWPRILPTGKPSGGVNKEGVNYYNNLIDELLANGIEPWVTLFHWDLPQVLYDEYMNDGDDAGFLSPKFVDDFRSYACVCFWEFGDRVKHWMTLNEPQTFCSAVYGLFVPAETPVPNKEKAGPRDKDRGSGPAEKPVMTLGGMRGFGENAAAIAAGLNAIFNIPAIAGGILEEMGWLPFMASGGKHEHRKYNSSPNSSAGDPSKEPYLMAHYLLLAHAAAVKLYRQRYKAGQKGVIGIALNSRWFEPLNENSARDKLAASRALDFTLGWFMDPITSGQYPATMQTNVGGRLPEFKEEERQELVGSFDFLGLNYYTSSYASDLPRNQNQGPGYETDSNVKLDSKRNGVPIGEKGSSKWVYCVPQGLYYLLKHIKQKYNNPLVYITENGVDQEADLKLSRACDDKFREKYIREHLLFVLKAIDEDANVKGYMMWSLLDNFEWVAGYMSCFGLINIDYRNELRRYPKGSAVWFMNFLKEDTRENPRKRLPQFEDSKGSRKKA